MPNTDTGTAATRTSWQGACYPRKDLGLFHQPLQTTSHPALNLREEPDASPSLHGLTHCCLRVYSKRDQDKIVLVSHTI